jgi:hypothetical protein
LTASSACADSIALAAPAPSSDAVPQTAGAVRRPGRRGDSFTLCVTDLRIAAQFLQFSDTIVTRVRWQRPLAVRALRFQPCQQSKSVAGKRFAPFVLTDCATRKTNRGPEHRNRKKYLNHTPPPLPNILHRDDKIAALLNKIIPAVHHIVT